MDCGQLDKARSYQFFESYSRQQMTQCTIFAITPSIQFFDKKLQVWFRTWTLRLREQEYKEAMVVAARNNYNTENIDDQQKDWEQNSSALAKRLESVKQKAGSVIKAVI